MIEQSYVGGGQHKRAAVLLTAALVGVIVGGGLVVAGLWILLDGSFAATVPLLLGIGVLYISCFHAVQGLVTVVVLGQRAGERS